MKMNGGKVGIVMMGFKKEKKTSTHSFPSKPQERSTYIREIWLVREQLKRNTIQSEHGRMEKFLLLEKTDLFVASKTFLRGSSRKWTPWHFCTMRSRYYLLIHTQMERMTLHKSSHGGMQTRSGPWLMSRSPTTVCETYLFITQACEIRGSQIRISRQARLSIVVSNSTRYRRSM